MNKVIIAHYIKDFRDVTCAMLKPLGLEGVDAMSLSDVETKVAADGEIIATLIDGDLEDFSNFQSFQEKMKENHSRVKIISIDGYFITNEIKESCDYSLGKPFSIPRLRAALEQLKLM